MNKMFKYFSTKQWILAFIALVFIVVQVWLDLELPGYMSEITTLVETEGSAMSDMGTHEELLQNCPEYLEIAKSQLSENELRK